MPTPMEFEPVDPEVGIPHEKRYSGRFDTSSVHALIAYLCLKDRLGKPSYENSDDINWQWEFKVDGVYFAAYDFYDEWALSAFVGPSQSEAEVKQVGNKLIESIAELGKGYSRRLTPALDQASGFIFRNPYQLYRSSAESMLETAIKSDKSMTMIDKFNNKSYFGNLLQSAFFLHVASLEGFLNLVYEIYLKPMLRDDRIQQRLAREQVDIKLRLAPMYCTCFGEHPIDHLTESFQRFQYIAEVRNDFIHANLTKPMRRFVVKEDDHEFVVDSVTQAKYELSRNVVDLTIDNIRFVRDTVDQVVEQVIQAMKPRYRHEFKPAIQEKEVFVSVVDNEYIVHSSY